MIKNKLLILSLFSLLFSCQTEQEEGVDPYPIEEGQSIKYNNEYLKVTDDDEAQNRPKRLINENAILNLGELEITWGEDTKKVTAFRKGGTDLHFSKNGVRMRISDMYDLQISLNIFHKKDPFGVAGNHFELGQGDNNRFEIEIEDKWEIGELNLTWKEAVMKIEQLKASTGEVKLQFSGKATNEISQETRPFTLKMTMRFEEITSSVRPG
jgi:hypothetical protein